MEKNDGVIFIFLKVFLSIFFIFFWQIWSLKPFILFWSIGSILWETRDPDFCFNTEYVLQQTFPQNSKIQLWIILCINFITVVPKVHWYKIGPIWTPLFCYLGSKVPKNGKMAKKGAHFYEINLCGKDIKLIGF